MKMMASPVSAGFPSPARDEEGLALDVEGLLIEHRESTFFWRVAGHSMTGMGIHDGDLLVVDRALPARSGSVVVAVLEGGFIVKQLIRQGNHTILRAAHADYPDLRLDPEQELTVWGVVRWSLHALHQTRSKA
jgi:DNA polymerase V